MLSKIKKNPNISSSPALKKGNIQTNHGSQPRRTENWEPQKTENREPQKTEIREPNKTEIREPQKTENWEPNKTENWEKFVKVFGNQEILERIIEKFDTRSDFLNFQCICKDAYFFTKLFESTWKYPEACMRVFGDEHFIWPQLVETLKNPESNPCMLHFWPASFELLKNLFLLDEFKLFAKSIKKIYLPLTIPGFFGCFLSILSEIKKQPDNFCNLKTLVTRYFPGENYQKFIKVLPDSIEHLVLYCNKKGKKEEKKEEIVISNLPNIKTITFQLINPDFFYNKCKVQSLPNLEKVILSIHTDAAEIELKDCKKNPSIENQKYCQFRKNRA